MVQISKIYKPSLTLQQREIIIGTVLGGSSIVKPKGGKNCYLSMRCKKGVWLEYKGNELRNLASSAPYTTTDTTYRWHSLCYPLFNEFREMFYEDGKRRLKPEVLDTLCDVGSSVWFVDCGRSRNRRLILNTHIWGEDGTSLIVEYFNAIDCPAEVMREKGYLRVRLTEIGSERWVKIIAPQVPTFVRI